MKIETENLRLIPCSETLLTSAIQGNEALAKALGFSVSPDWTEFGMGPLEYSLKMLAKGEEEKGWWTYLPIHKADRRLIGSCGYKGRPGREGVVELGYEVCPAYRQKGLGTEMAEGLLRNAFGFGIVNRVIAHTLPTVSASTRILEKLNFVKTGEVMDPEDGLIWRWELQRQHA